jgi:hypothetical protein
VSQKTFSFLSGYQQHLHPSHWITIAALCTTDKQEHCIADAFNLMSPCMASTLETTCIVCPDGITLFVHFVFSSAADDLVVWESGNEIRLLFQHKHASPDCLEAAPSRKIPFIPL